MIKKYSRAFALLVVPFIGSLAIRFLYFTNKKEFHCPKEITDKPFILACWHSDLLMLPYFYMHYKPKPNVKAMISNHFDGALIATTMKWFDIGNLAGSSTRNAAKVLIEAIRTIKAGTDVAITPDGPKGPRHEVAEGIYAIAKKTKAQVIIVAIKPSSYWQLNSWDKFMVPKPCGTLHFYSPEAFDICDLSSEEATKLVKEKLLAYEK